MTRYSVQPIDRILKGYEFFYLLLEIWVKMLVKI